MIRDHEVYEWQAQGLVQMWAMDAYYEEAWEEMKKDPFYILLEARYSNVED